MLMVAITSHFVDNDFVYHEDLLSFRHVPTSHTGKNLAAHVYGILHEFNIRTKLFCITTDSASNNGEMMKELSKLLRKKDSIKWNGLTHHIRCLAHVINLAVKVFLLNLKIAPLSEEHHWIANGETSDDDDKGDDGEPTSDDDLDDDVSSIDSNSDNDDDIDNDDDDEEFDVKNTQDFKTVLQSSNDLKSRNCHSKAHSFIQFILSSRETQILAPDSRSCNPLERNIQYVGTCAVSQTHD